MQNQRIMPDLIKAFIEKASNIPDLKDESVLSEKTLIEFIYKMTSPRNEILLDNYLQTNGIELDKINRWKGVKANVELNEMYKEWMESLTKRSNEPFFAFMLSIYDAKLNDLPAIIEKSQTGIENPLFGDFKEATEIEKFKSTFSNLTDFMNSKDGVNTIDFEPIIKFTGLNQVALKGLKPDQQLQLIGLALLEHYFDHLLFLDLKDEFFKQKNDGKSKCYIN